jgi:hypothetical protein
MAPTLGTGSTEDILASSSPMNPCVVGIFSSLFDDLGGFAQITRRMRTQVTSDHPSLRRGRSARWAQRQ